MTPEVKERIEQIRRGIVPEDYRKTKAGIVPTDWSECTIADCLERVERPVEVKADEMYTQIGIRSHGKGLFYKEPVRGEELGNKAVFWIEPDCFVLNIVFAWEQAIGKTTQAEVGMIGSHRFPMYRPVDGKIDIDYLISYLMTKRGKDILEAASPGGAGRNRTLGQDRFMNSKIVLPTPAEQKKIAEILTTQDKVIELKEKLLAEKQRQKKHLAQRVFENAKKTVALSEIADITMGQSPSSRSYNTTLTGVPLIQGNADILNRKPLPRMYTSSPTKMCSPGDILLSVRAPVGTVAQSTIGACIGRGVCSIRPHSMQGYIYEFLLYYESKWGKVSQGSTFESISGDDIAKLQIPQCNDSEQKTKLLTMADHEIDLLWQNLEQEKQKKKALMQLLLTGIARV